MLKRLIAMIRSERALPIDLRRELVDGLFYPFASLITGAIAGLWIAATVTLMVEDLLVQAVADSIVIVALARIFIGFRYVSLGAPAGPDTYRNWELAYAIGAGLFALLLGLVTLLALTRVDNQPLHLMLTVTTAGYAASITGRNAGRPWIALSQLYLAAAPMCLGLFLHGTTFYQVLGVALFLFMFGMTDITVSVRKTLVGALETRRRNAELASSFERQANLFDAALNNMSHGLAMFDGEGRLLVWNNKLTRILMAPRLMFETGLPLDELLARLARDRVGERNAPLAEAIAGSFRSKRGGRQNFVRLSDGKVVAVSRQKMENGNVVIVFEDVTEQAKAHDRIRQLAWTDELTGLMNRASFQEVLRKSLDQLGHDAALALHLIDLDHFKAVNDTLGHPIGDLLLIEVSKRIADAAAEEGHVARLGGDEFVIIQERGQGLEPRQLAERVVASLGRTFEVAGHRINIGASVGVALAPEHGRTPEVLLKRADMALYQAKAHGRNNVTFFEDDFDLHAQQRRELELDIRTAIAEHQFTLAFQPIVDAMTGSISAFETLIRWKHPIRGYVSPAEFIPVAEETGLIIDIGRWVLDEACRQAVSWPSDAAVAVNFSAVQFNDRQFPMFLAATLQKHGLRPGRLELEITETALLEDCLTNRDVLEQIRSLGVRISLDDFGTGYSSLSQLRTFPFNKIKIDGSFVRDLGRDQSSVAVIRAVTSIGDILGMTVVAECVESEEQLQFLVKAGCDEIQGFLLGRPTEASEVPALLAAHTPGTMKRLLAA